MRLLTVQVFCLNYNLIYKVTTNVFTFPVNIIPTIPVHICFCQYNLRFRSQFLVCKTLYFLFLIFFFFLHLSEGHGGIRLARRLVINPNTVQLISCRAAACLWHICFSTARRCWVRYCTTGFVGERNGKKNSTPLGRRPLRRCDARVPPPSPAAMPCRTRG